MSTIKDFNNRKEVHMIYNPKFGWCNFKLGTFFGTPSYLTDVPVDLLDAFINYYEKGSGTVVFDEEGSHFTLVLTSYNLGIFIIEEKEKPILYNLCDMEISSLKDELIRDIEQNFEEWVRFITSDDEEDILSHRKELETKLAKLKKLG